MRLVTGDRGPGTDECGRSQGGGVPSGDGEDQWDRYCWGERERWMGGGLGWNVSAAGCILDREQ